MMRLGIYFERLAQNRGIKQTTVCNVKSVSLDCNSILQIIHHIMIMNYPGHPEHTEQYFRLIDKKVIADLC